MKSLGHWPRAQESCSQMAMIRSKGGVVLNKYLVARVFAFDDHVSEARAA